MTNNPTIDGVSLLPCPFCGCQPRYVPADYIDSHGQPWPFAECDPCNVGAPIEFWQKRTGFDYSAHALQSTIDQLEDKLNKAIDLDFQRRETIEKLQARVQELESGRGEPVGFGTFKNGKYGSWLFHDEASARSHLKTANDGRQMSAEIRALFTAPPAPVAVVLPNDWQDTLLEEMERRFSLRKMLDDDHMVNDDTQIGVEFAIEWIEACLDAALNGERK